MTKLTPHYTKVQMTEREHYIETAQVIIIVSGAAIAVVVTTFIHYIKL